MKTSLIIEDSVFREAKKEALQTGKTISEIISFWARMGRKILRERSPRPKRRLKSVDLGGPAMIDITSRRDWMDLLDK